MDGAYAVVRGGSSTSNLIEPSRTLHYRDSEVFRVLSHEFLGGLTVPNFLYLHRYRGNKVCRVLML